MDSKEFFDSAADYVTKLNEVAKKAGIPCLVTVQVAVKQDDGTTDILKAMNWSDLEPIDLLRMAVNVPATINEAVSKPIR